GATRVLMTMCIRAGYGARNLQAALLLAALLSITLPCAAQNSATGAPADWVEGGAFLLPAGAFKILLLQQTGPDLIVRVSTLADTAASGEPSTVISSFEQHGHDKDRKSVV